MFPLQFRSGLWHHPDFRKLWIGQTISSLGSEMTNFALPLTAVFTLHATPIEMGMLGAAQFTPFLLLGLFAGVWVDRLRRRPILIGADLGRALLLGTIPLMAVLGWLRIELLYSVAFCVGILTVFFDVAYHSFLTSLVKREELMEGNSKLFASRSIAQTIGPGLAGSLVQLLSAPVVIMFDGLSFLVSVFFLSLIHIKEPTPEPADTSQNIWQAISEGLQWMIQHSLMRPLTACFTTLNFFWCLLLSVNLLYLTRELGITPTLLGVIFAISSIGAILGALLSAYVVRLWGLGSTLIGSIFGCGLGFLCTPLVSGTQPMMVLLLSLAGFLSGLMGMINNVNQLSLRQAIAPDHLQGRVNATTRFLVWGIRPVGFLIGGILAEVVGVRATLLVGAVGMLLSVLWLWFSPVRHLRQLSASDV